MAPVANDWGPSSLTVPHIPRDSLLPLTPGPFPSNKPLHIQVLHWGKSEFLDQLTPHTKSGIVLWGPSLYTAPSTSRILPFTIMDMPLAWMRTDSSLPKLEARKQVLDSPKHIWLFLCTHGGFNLKDTARTLPSEPLHPLCAHSPVTGRGFLFPWGWDSSS